MPISTRPSYQPGFTVLVAMSVLACVVSCAASNTNIRAARSATYQADRAIVYEQALAAVSRMYPVEKLSDPTDQMIYTRWQVVKSTGPTPGRVQEFDSKEDNRLRGGGGFSEKRGQNQIRYIRFQIEVAGDSPWQVRVSGQASETPPSPSNEPRLLRRREYPAWFRSRIDNLQVAIHQNLKAYAIEFDSSPRSSSEPPNKTAQTSSASEQSANTESWSATVHVRGASSGMLVSALSERLEAEGNSPKFYWKELCAVPCSFRLMPGLQDVKVESRSGLARERLELQPGSSTYLRVEPGRESLSLIAGGVLVAGLAGILVGSGAMLWKGIEPWSLWTVGGGLGGLALGMGMGVASLPSITEESAPKRTVTPKAISFSGSF